MQYLTSRKQGLATCNQGYSKVRRIFRSSTFKLLDLVNQNWLLSNGVNDDDRNKGGLYNGKYGGTTIAGFGAAI